VRQVGSELQTMTVDYIPHYSADLTLLDSTSLRKYEILGSVPVCQAVDSARYELTHLSATLDLMRSLAPYVVTSRAHRHYLQSVKSSCARHIVIVKEALETAKKKLQEI